MVGRLSVQPEKEVRFPWTGGRHPWLDVLIATDTALIGVESKRYEPFRAIKPAEISDKFSKSHYWGDRMKGYERVRDEIRADNGCYGRLDAAQLIKHALALRTAVTKVGGEWKGKRPVLYYLYAEPERWPNGPRIVEADLQAHRDKLQEFASAVDGEEVKFFACTYSELLKTWSECGNPVIVAHSTAVLRRFFS